MYHVYEQVTEPTDRLAVLSDRDWEELTTQQRAGYRLRAGGFRTGLEAVVQLIELQCDGEPVLVTRCKDEKDERCGMKN